MISIINFFKDNYLIILILVTGSLFKIPVIWESYPIVNNLDEPYLINSGLRVLNNIYLYKSLDPEFYTWGSFPIYVCAFLNSILILTKYFFFNPYNLSLEALSYSIQRIDFYIINRIFSFLLMNLSIFIVYYLCKKNFNYFVAILASIILVISPKYLSLSTMATVDHWHVFFSALIVFYSFELNRNFNSMKNIAIYAVVLGISVATKYYNFLFIIPIITILITRIIKKEFPYRQIILLSSISLFAFFISMPYSLINFSDFLNSLESISNNYKSHPGADSDFNNSYLLLIKYFFSMSFVNSFISTISLVSIFFLLLKKKNEYLILLTYPIIFCIFIGNYNVFFTRNLISIVPYIAILSSILIYNFYLFIKKKVNKNYFFVILFLIFFPTLKINYFKIKNSFLEDTRYTSLKWVQSNINPNDQILAGHYSPPVWDLKNFRNARRLWFLRDFDKDQSIREIDSGAKYIILSSYAYSIYFNVDGSLKKKYENKGKLYQQFFKNNELIKSFKPDYQETAGPEIRIYLNKIYKKTLND